MTAVRKREENLVPGAAFLVSAAISAGTVNFASAQLIGKTHSEPTAIVAVHPVGIDILVVQRAKPAIGVKKVADLEAEHGFLLPELFAHT
jgi:predicted cation transporter